MIRAKLSGNEWLIGTPNLGSPFYQEGLKFPDGYRANFQLPLPSIEEAMRKATSLEGADRNCGIVLAIEVARLRRLLAEQQPAPLFHWLGAGADAP